MLHFVHSESADEAIRKAKEYFKLQPSDGSNPALIKGIHAYCRAVELLEAQGREVLYSVLLDERFSINACTETLMGRTHIRRTHTHIETGTHQPTALLRKTTCSVMLTFHLKQTDRLPSLLNPLSTGHHSHSAQDTIPTQHRTPFPLSTGHHSHSAQDTIPTQHRTPFRTHRISGVDEFSN